MRAFWILLIFVAAVSVSGCTQNNPLQNSNPNQNINQQSEGIGDLCSDKGDCETFCKDNLGQCTQFCKSNPDNKICKEGFDFDMKGMIPKERSPQILKLIDNRDCSKLQFSEYFVDPSIVGKVGPIGSVHGSGTIIVRRSYVSLKDEVTEKAPVYAPTDILLTAGSYHTPQMPGKGLPDYTLVFDVGCGYTMQFDHIKEVIPEIEKRFPEIDTTSGTNQIDFLLLRAGDLIGWFIPNSGVAGFDFILDSDAVTNKFPTQERYSKSNLLHGVCPYDLYQGEMKSTYYDLFGGGGGTLFKVKDCGSVSRDVLGTISGQWFLDKEPTSVHNVYKEGDYGTPISIVGDEERINIGHLGVPVNWIYPNNPTYKDPLEVKGEHCYQIRSSSNIVDGYIYFNLVSNTEMQVFYSKTGTCPSSFPQTGSKTYYK